jgi:RNA polymerase sigma-70 factor (ECF subfamily)
MSKLSDSDLVERTLAGSQEAFGDLVVRYQRPIFGLIVRMVRNQATAEELAQDVFIKAYRNLASFDRRRKFSSWLFKVAHNATIDHLRRRQLDTVPLEPQEDEGPRLAELLAGPEREGPESVAMRSELTEQLEAAMAELRPEHREILLLRFRQGLSYAELAEVLDLALGTVKTHLHRARKRLAKLLEESEWRPEE